MNGDTGFAHRHLDLAVVGNCEVNALIDYHGRVVWMCLPRPDGDPVFAALLSKGQGVDGKGVFAVDLHGLERAEQCYQRNTAIVETLLYDGRGGAMKITDFAPRFRSRGRVFRPMMLVRIIEPLAGRPLVKLRLRPVSDYGAQALPPHQGSNHLSYTTGSLAYRVTSDASISSLTGERSVVLDRALSFIIGPDETIEESFPASDPPSSDPNPDTHDAITPETPGDDTPQPA